MEIVLIIVIIIVAVLVLTLLASRLGLSGSARDRHPEWPDRSHQVTGTNIDGGPGTGGGGDGA